MTHKYDQKQLVGAAMLDGGRCLVCRHGEGTSLAGRWAFPGGKVGPGESPATALVRAIRQKLGMEVRVHEWLARSEVLSEGTFFALDVFTTARHLFPGDVRDYQEIRWASAEELPGLEWAELDIAILPAVQARLRTRYLSVLAVDWAVDLAKRAAYSGRRMDTGWSIRREVPPASGWTLGALAARAEQVASETSTAVLIAIDAALGLPVSMARRLGASTFLDALSKLFGSGGLTGETEQPGSWCVEKPFFRVPARNEGLSDFIAAAGGRSMLFRQIELQTGGKPTFVLSGIPGTVGSGSRSLWNEIGRMGTKRGFRIWPFEESIGENGDGRRILLGETYPRAVYAVALSEQLPAAPQSIRKTDGSARRLAVDRLRKSTWIDRHQVQISQPDADEASAGEDDFDAMMTAAGLVRLIAEGRPLASFLVDPLVEGGILGTGNVTLNQRRTGKPRRVRGVSVRNPPLDPRICPIPDCGWVFATGRLGWDAHVGAVQRHPQWHPEISRASARHELFRVEFASWFGDE